MCAAVGFDDGPGEVGVGGKRHDRLGNVRGGGDAGQPDTTLILHGRDQTRLDDLTDALADTPATIRTVRADFSELAQVHRLADDVEALTDHVSVPVNNAGIGGGEPDGNDRRLTVDRYELRFAVNHLAAFALTQRLLPLLDRGAPARIVNVASLSQAPIDFDDPFLAHGHSGTRAYAQSKLAMITTGLVLAQNLDPQRITVNSLHPATYMPTKVVFESVGHSIDSLETGLKAILHLINSPELDGITGQFFDRTRSTRAPRRLRPQRPTATMEPKHQTHHTAPVNPWSPKNPGRHHQLR